MKSSLFWSGEMEMDTAFLTCLLSVTTMYSATMLTLLCIVDFFSYRRPKILYITLSYLFLLPTIFVAISYYLRSMQSGATLWRLTFEQSFGNLLTASTLHLILVLFVIVLHSGDILSATKSLTTSIQKIIRANMRS